jgi:hypothetical protein
MYDFEESLDTAATPEQLWAIYSDVPGWRRWAPQLEAVHFTGPFASGATGYATVAVGLSADVQFALENVDALKRYDVVWTVGPLLYTRMTHTIERLATGARIKHAYHTGGVMSPFNFLQAAAAHERARPGMMQVAKLAESDAR